MRFENIHFIINPAAGQPAPVLHTINSVLYETDIAWHVAITQRSTPANVLAQRAVEAGADLVIAYGGDGTVKGVINGLIEHNVPLGILHGGTGNAMAYELGIPADLAQAVKLLLGGHTFRQIDIGKASHPDQDEPGYFMLRASAGLQSEILKTATREAKTQYGNLAYVIASLQRLAESQLARYTLEIDGETVTAEGLTCMITNSASIGGRNSFRFAPRVDPADGKLDVLVLDASFESLVAAVQNALEPESAPLEKHWTGCEITVRTENPQEVALDGEPFGETPLAFSVIPGAVRVLVPEQ